jgi:hypothetical protein
MEVEWVMCKGNIWCELNKIDAHHKNLEDEKGVYIIWSGRDQKSVLRIGHGLISDEIIKNQKDIAIHAFLQYGVFVTWCPVGFRKEGVVAFLQNLLKPKFSDNRSTASAVKVNLPW